MVQPGTYMKSAYISDATIDNEKIGNIIQSADGGLAWKIDKEGSIFASEIIIGAGKTSFDDNTAGIFLGRDITDNSYVFEIGDINSYISWDGLNLEIGGSQVIHGDMIINGTLNVPWANITDVLVTNAQIDNVIESTNANPEIGTGWRLNKDGTIDTAGITIRNNSGNVILSSGTGLPDAGGRGVNICNAEYSYWESDILPTIRNGWYCTPVLMIGEGYLGKNSIRLDATGADAYAYLGTSSSDYNIDITPNKKWIVSFYAKLLTDNSPKTTGAAHFYLRPSATGHHRGTSFNVPADAVWRRYSTVIDLSADNSTSAVMRIENESFNNSGTTYLYFDGIMIEEQVGGSADPSAYSRPSPGQITSANATTYIANAAIGGAQIQNVSITNANIADAAVNTLQLAGYAVTVPTSAYIADGPTYFSGSTWHNVITTPGIESSGITGVKVIVLSYNMTIYMAVNTNFQWRISRGSTVVFSSVAGFSTLSSGHGRQSYTFQYRATPTDGNVGYTLQIQVGYGSMTLHDISAVALGSKR